MQIWQNTVKGELGLGYSSIIVRRYCVHCAVQCSMAYINNGFVVPKMACDDGYVRDDRSRSRTERPFFLPFLLPLLFSNLTQTQKRTKMGTLFVSLSQSLSISHHAIFFFGAHQQNSATVLMS
jgi:hypothetical protein